jgi:hypothetical protein
MNARPMFDPAVAKRYQRWALGLGALVWFTGIVFGTRRLLDYENTPSVRADAPKLWPAASRIPHTPGMPVIVVMGHPKCPCTRATIGELALLMTRLQSQATAAVLFIHPDGAPADWEKTDLWQSAAAIPGVTVLADPRYREADLFGAQASGQTFLYDRSGLLEFNGGITALRGHSGDNAGRSSIVALVTGEGDFQRQTSVFGCSLRTPDPAEMQEEFYGR